MEKYIANVYKDTYQDEKGVCRSDSYEDIVKWIKATKDKVYNKSAIWEWQYDKDAGGYCYNLKERM